ncbi:isochorismatase family protein [Pseudonocardia endophytica]|uniref:Isochorismatase family protein n=1 Tax=Pseudonocardia endophytica TaxID=401976 RepID=A0A4R1I225_PSEEN|nr:isochorismatase family protein [Pseudonocardia endophytica]TCK27645.1 isochorismatase family protein [Pseudonocardia endophytica]
MRRPRGTYPRSRHIGALAAAVDELADLTRHATAVVDKRVYTMFSDEGLALADEQAWTDMFVCGIDTEVCVLKTAVDAFELGIRPWLVTDASASHSGQEPHNAGVLFAQKMIGRKQAIACSEIEGILSLES